MKMLKGMTNRQYHKAKAVSKSHLHNLRVVPAGALVEMEPSASANLGTAGHTFILENHLYEDSVIESINKTSTGKNFQELVENNPDKTVLTAGGMDKVEEMAGQLWLHPKAKELLGGGYVAEPSFFWKDEDTGIWCKTRPDFVDFDRGIVGDLKFLSKGKADPRKFTWACRDFGYDLQAAWNIYGIHKVMKQLLREFWFIVVETDAPYRVACYQLDEEWLGDALYECKALLETERQCRENNLWPNFTNDNADGEILFRGI